MNRPRPELACRLHHDPVQLHGATLCASRPGSSHEDAANLRGEASCVIVMVILAYQARR
jgi:hypothetical protein